MQNLVGRLDIGDLEMVDAVDRHGPVGSSGKLAVGVGVPGLHVDLVCRLVVQVRRDGRVDLAAGRSSESSYRRS